MTSQTMLKAIAACVVVSAGVIGATTQADARSRSTYICFSDAKFHYGSGGIVGGTHTEGRVEFYGNDTSQEEKRKACIDANRQFNLILDRLKRGPERLARPFRESDCVITGERYDRRHSGWHSGTHEAPHRDSERPHWALIGQGDVDPLSDRHVLRIHPDHDGRYSRIKLHILRHDVRIGKIDIEYGNGATERWDVNKTIKDESDGPEFDLKGHERHIRKMQVEFQATNPFSHSGIQVFGLSE